MITINLFPSVTIQNYYTDIDYGLYDAHYILMTLIL